MGWPRTRAAWIHQADKHCYTHPFLLGAEAQPKAYATLAAARAVCDAHSGCGGVWQPHPVRYSALFFLCDGFFPFEPSTAGGRVLEKPAARAGTSLSHTYTADTGARCSTACCCPESSWRGDTCADFDECASKPCKRGGTCTDSAVDYRVNDYFRKYRCECKPGYDGHDCEVAVAGAQSRDPLCVMQAGAKSALAATGTVKKYREFQAALDILSTTLKSSGTNFQRFCTKVFKDHTAGGVCGQRYTLYDYNGVPIAQPVVNCKNQSEGFTIMHLCTSPCMLDTTSVCCFVPAEFSWMFPCCRQLKCCADQRRRLGQKPQPDKEPNVADELETEPTNGPSRAAPGVAIAVSVEEISSSKTQYELLQECLGNATYASSHPPCADILDKVKAYQNANLIVGSAPTLAPTQSNGQASRRRHLGGSGGAATNMTCGHGGKAPACVVAHDTVTVGVGKAECEAKVTAGFTVFTRDVSVKVLTVRTQFNLTKSNLITGKNNDTYVNTTYGWSGITNCAEIAKYNMCREKYSKLVKHCPVTCAKLAVAGAGRNLAVVCTSAASATLCAFPWDVNASASGTLELARMALRGRRVTATSGANLSLVDCTLRDGTGAGHAQGGALELSAHGSAALLVGTTFDANAAAYGGAAWLGGGTVRIHLGMFTSNVATKRGGALYVEDAVLFIERGVFSANKAGADGGSAVWVSHRRSVASTQAAELSLRDTVFTHGDCSACSTPSALRVDVGAVLHIASNVSFANSTPSMPALDVAVGVAALPDSLLKVANYTGIPVCHCACVLVTSDVTNCPCAKQRAKWETFEMPACGAVEVNAAQASAKLTSRGVLVRYCTAAVAPLGTISVGNARLAVVGTTGHRMVTLLLAWPGRFEVGGGGVVQLLWVRLAGQTATNGGAAWVKPGGRLDVLGSIFHGNKAVWHNLPCR